MYTSLYYLYQPFHGHKSNGNWAQNSLWKITQIFFHTVFVSFAGYKNVVFFFFYFTNNQIRYHRYVCTYDCAFVKLRYIYLYLFLLCYLPYENIEIEQQYIFLFRNQEQSSSFASVDRIIMLKVMKN